MIAVFKRQAGPTVSHTGASWISMRCMWPCRPFPQTHRGEAIRASGRYPSGVQLAPKPLGTQRCHMHRIDAADAKPGLTAPANVRA